jgi:NitT/TauT family transport system permease protein/taurine transport system permease protein
MTRMRTWVLSLIPPLVIIVMWSVLPGTLDIPAYRLPTPWAVLEEFGSLIADGTLLGHLLASLGRLVMGMIVGSLLGAVVGFGIGTSSLVRDLLLPPLTFFQAIAGVAWIPLAIVWFGFGTGPVVFVIANAAFFLVLLNTILGVRSIPAAVIDSVRVLGGGRWAVLREVLIPGSLVHVLVGLESALAFSWRALIAAELIIASDGLGLMTGLAATYFETPTVIVGILTIGVAWMAMEIAIIRPIRRVTVDRWGLLESV